MDVYEIRRRRLKQIIKEDFKGVDARFAERIKKAPTVVYRWFTDKSAHRRNVGEKLARSIEKATGKPELWLDSMELSNVGAGSPHSDQPRLVAQKESDYLVGGDVMLNTTEAHVLAMFRSLPTEAKGEIVKILTKMQYEPASYEEERNPLAGTGAVMIREPIKNDKTDPERTPPSGGGHSGSPRKTPK